MVASGSFISQLVIPFYIVIDKEKRTLRKVGGHALYDQNGEDWIAWWRHVTAQESADLVPPSAKSITMKKRSVKSTKPLPDAEWLRLTAVENEPTISIVSSWKKQQERTAVSFDRS